MSFILSFQNVVEYLADLDICQTEDLTDNKIEQKPAKNFNLLVSFPDNRKLLVKQERFNQQGEQVALPMFACQYSFVLLRLLFHC